MAGGLVVRGWCWRLVAVILLLIASDFGAISLIGAKWFLSWNLPKQSLCYRFDDRRRFGPSTELISFASFLLFTLTFFDSFRSISVWMAFNYLRSVFRLLVVLLEFANKWSLMDTSNWLSRVWRTCVLSFVFMPLAAKVWLDDKFSSINYPF